MNCHHVLTVVHAYAAEPVGAKGPALVAHPVDQLCVSPRGCEPVRSSCSFLLKFSNGFELSAESAPILSLLHFLGVAVLKVPETGVRAQGASQGDAIGRVGSSSCTIGCQYVVEKSKV